MKVPSPLPSNTLTVPGCVTPPRRVSMSLLLVTARSGRPSPLKSATATAIGVPASRAKFCGAWKVPSPLPSEISTDSNPGAVGTALARSGLPSPLKSPVATIAPLAAGVGGLEGAVAVAQQERMVHDEVGMAVAVEVRHRNRVGAGRHGEADRGQKGAGAAVQQHAH